MKSNEQNVKSNSFFHEVAEGGVYTQKTGIGQWKYLPQAHGTLVVEWIDSCEQYDRLSAGDVDECRAAFRRGFEQGMRILAVKLDPVPPHIIRRFERAADDMDDGPIQSAVDTILHEAKENAFAERILFRWKHTYALPHPDCRRVAGKRIFVNEHWQHAAYLRGFHAAMEHMMNKWVTLVRTTKGNVNLLEVFLDTTIPAQIRDSDYWSEDKFSPALLRQHEINDGKYECMVPIH